MNRGDALVDAATAPRGRRRIRSQVAALGLLLTALGAPSCGGGGDHSEGAGSRVGYAIGLTREGGHVVLRSEDDARTWTVVLATPAELKAIAFLDAERGWALAPSELLYTEDAGRSWVDQYASLPRAGTLRALSAAGPSRAIVYVNGPGDPLHGFETWPFYTEDGHTWHDGGRLGGQSANSVCILASGVGAALGPLGVFVTETGGAEWRLGLRVLDFEAVHPSPAVAQTSCAGASTLWVSGWSPADFFVSQPRPEAPLALLFVSTDAGRTWSDVSQDLPPALTGPPLDTVSPADDTVWIAPTYDSSPDVLAVFRTIDGARSWSQRTIARPQGESPAEAIAAMDFRAADFGVVFTSSPHGYVTRDGGDSWESARIPSEIVRIADVDVP